MTSGLPQREAWQAASAGQNTKAQRIGTAIFLLLFAVIAVVIFVITMRGPSVASPFVQTMFVPDYNQLVDHSPYVQTDIQRIRDLFLPPGESGTSTPYYNEYAINSAAPLTDQSLQSDMLKNFAACKSKDIAIFYIAANGVVDEEGRPGLLSSDGKFNRLDELLSQINAVSASTRLVFVDAGQIDEDYLNGQPVNAFPFALHQLLASRSGDSGNFDENLWVINSHGLFQSSRLSHTRRGSVFGISVADALLDFCQNADQNKPIKLGPLYQSICERCAAMTMIDDRPAQIPVLMRGGHGIVFYSDLEDRSQAMAQDVIYPRQMIRPKVAESDEADLPPTPEGTEADRAKEVVGATAETPKPVEPVPGAEVSSLERIWNLRDQLQNRQLGRGYSPIDFAPQIWVRINDQIVFFDQRIRRGDPASKELESTEKDLRLLSEKMQANEVSTDARYQGNLLDVSARLVAEWNRFVTATSAATVMNQDLAACRDIYFRSRYFLEWTRIPAFPNSKGMQDDYLALIEELKRIMPLSGISPLLVNPVVQATDLETISESAAKLRTHEQRMFGHMSRLIAEWDKDGTSLSATNVSRSEGVFTSLLDSPLLSYTNPFGFVATGPETDLPKNLSRKSLNESWTSLLAQNHHPLPPEDSAFQWATDLWIAPRQGNVNESLTRMKIAHSFLELAGGTNPIDTGRECQLPERSRTDLPQWEDEFSSCLKTLFDSGHEISVTQQKIAKSISNAKPGGLQAWPLAVLLDKKTAHAIEQPLDDLFNALPPQIESIAEPVVVEFDTRPGKIDTTLVNLDQPNSTRKYYFIARGGEPRNIELKLSMDESDQEFRGLLEFESNEAGVIELDRPFKMPLVRDERGELRPLTLTIKSNPSNARQSRQQVGFNLRLTGSDDARVMVNENESLRLTVQLPREDRVDVVVGNASFSKYSVSAVTGVESRIYYDRQSMLYAFPNRYRNFDVRVENKSGRTKSFRLELYSVVRPNSNDTTGALPGQVIGKAIQDPEVLARRLELLKQATLGTAPLATSKEIDIAPDNGQLLDFRPEPLPPSEATGSTVPPAGDTAGLPVPAPSFAVNNGIYCRLSETDVEHGRQITRDFWFDVRPLPSEDLVGAIATFDPVNSLFSVEVEAQWGDGVSCPVTGGVACVLESGNSGDFQLNIARRMAMLNDENRRGELQFKIEQEELSRSGPILLYVNVNEYRGAFIYRIDESDFQGPARDKPNLRPDNNFLVLRQIVTQIDEQPPVVHWKSGNSWAFKPPKKIMFEVLADLDDGTSDECTIQLDIKREVWNESETQIRFSDRQVNYLASVNKENGQIDLQAVVKDHSFDWTPTENYSGRCELRGKVDFSEDRTDSVTGKTEFLETLLIDGEPPTLLETNWVINGVKQGTFPTVKENQVLLQLEFLTDDLAGTKGIRLFVDKDNDPAIGDAETELGTMAPIGTKENWKYLFDIETQLAAKALSFGDNRIYAILVDQLDNETEKSEPLGPFTLTIEELTAQEKAMIAEAKIKKYTLNVRSFYLDAFGERSRLLVVRPRVVGSDDKEILFKSEANADGSYSIKNVPVGEYTLVGEYERRTSTGRQEKMRAELIVKLTDEKAPDPIVLILEVVKDDP